MVDSSMHAKPGDPCEIEPPARPVAGLRERLADFERACLLEALAATGGNQTRAALLLGLPRRTLLNKLKAHGIRRSRRTDEIR